MRQRILFFIFAVLGVFGCSTPARVPPKPVVTDAGSVPNVILDFEKPDPGVDWVAERPGSPPETAPVQTQPDAATPLKRTSLRPQGGLWSMSVALGEAGEIRYRPGKPLDLGSLDMLTAQVAHADAPARNGECVAAIVLTDAEGTTVRGDAFPVISQWESIFFDLKLAFSQGLDISRIVSVRVALCPAGRADVTAPLVIQTDTWAARSDYRKYLGSSVGPANSFYVEGRGSTLSIGTVGKYEITLFDRGATFPDRADKAAATPPSWLTIASGSPAKKVLGQGGTGLMLLDQTGLDALGMLRRQGADDAPANVAAGSGTIPRTAWPTSVSPELSTIHWYVAWSSPVAAIIEGMQESGPYDRLGLPAVTIKWQLMMYQWGQVFVHVHWTKSSELRVPDPISWALVRDDSTQLPSETSPDRLLAEIYPATFREGLSTALPDRMQSAAPMGMIARTNAQKNTWWWAVDNPATESHRRVFGAGIVGGLPGEADCMLLLNSPDALTKAASFGQYLVPPKIVFRQGELDRTIPGDSDNDGFVEAKGYFDVRLANGRAAFTIYPQERLILYPPILFTVPAVERETLDLKHSKLLINIDGKQFANPPQFPDGSFLLQIPYMIAGDRPVSVEAVLVK